MAICDKDVSIRSGHDTRRGSEVVFITAGNSGLAESHQDLSIGTEFADNVPRLHAGFGCNRHGLFRRCIGHPHITFPVDMHSMRPDEHLSAEALHDIPLRVELVNRVVRLEFAIRVHAVDPETAASGDRHGAGLIASNNRPDALTVGIDVHRCRRSHLSSSRKPRPFTSGDARPAAIGQSPDGTVRIVSGSLGERHYARSKKCHDGARCDPSHSDCLRHDAPLFRNHEPCTAYSILR